MAHVKHKPNINIKSHYLGDGVSVTHPPSEVFGPVDFHRSKLFEQLALLQQLQGFPLHLGVSGGFGGFLKYGDRNHQETMK